MAKPVVLRALTSPTVTWINDPRAAIEPTQRMLAFQVESGDIPKAPSADGLFDVRFYERATQPDARR